jgi:hypothetical protein
VYYWWHERATFDRDRERGDGGGRAGGPGCQRPDRVCWRVEADRHAYGETRDVGCHGQRASSWRRRGLLDAIVSTVSRRFHQLPEPNRRTSGVDGRRWHAERGVELDRHRGLPEVSTARQERAPSDGGAVPEHPARCRSRVRTFARRRNIPSRHASGRDVHCLSAWATFREQRRRPTRHVLVGECVGPLAPVRAAPCLG